jgi:hypothetical protein
MNFGTKGCMYCEGKCTKECISIEYKQKKMEQIKCYAVTQHIVIVVH